ncbi:MAG: hypothetical protein ACRES5_34480, partial [Pseudomonas sp.]
MSQDKIGLRIQGIVLCDGAAEDVDRFLRLLRWLAEKELSFETVPHDACASPQVTSDEIKEFLQLPDGPDGTLDRLYEILNAEYWGQGGSARSLGDWSFAIGRDAFRFAEVETVDDYLASRVRWESEGKKFSSVSEENYESPSRADPYVNASVITAIEERASQSTWNCDKLLQLIRELNDNYASGNFYSTHVILRAIPDHIPPILGFADFKQVANNYSWSRTDEKYVKRLLDFKAQGDDVLHRQISRSGYIGLLGISDMPSPVCVRTLLY